MTDFPRATLVPHPAEHLAKPIPLREGTTSIGRAPSNEVQLIQGGISRTHARITFKNGQFVLTDLGSRNGSFVNSESVKEAVLNHNDKILFGQRGFVFKIEGADLEEAAPDFESDFYDTVAISEEELQLSGLLTHKADSAALNFFEPPRPDQKQPDLAAIAHKRLSFLYQLSEHLRSAAKPDDILGKGLEYIFKAMPWADRGVAMLRSEMTGALEARAVKYGDQHPEEATIPISRTVLEEVVQEKVAVVSRDIQEDPRFNDSDSIVIHDIKSIICVPMVRRSRVIGAIHVDTRDYLNPFNRSDMEFTAAVANELALSIENCFLQQKAINNEKMAAVGLTITNLAHNIKNLLNVNVNFVDLMDIHMQKSNDGDIRKCWRFVRESLEKIAGLTADMLEYTQIDACETKRIDINALILTDCDPLRENLAQEGIQLELNLASDLPPWPMSEIRLQRALLNLVVNAKYALKEVDNGRIKISTEMDAQRNLVIRVEDNGCGITKDELNRIFDLFYTTKGLEGSGLGLSMTQKFVENLGGRVSVISQVGAGTVVSMVFPEPPSG